MWTRLSGDQRDGEAVGEEKAKGEEKARPGKKTSDEKQEDTPKVVPTLTEILTCYQTKHGKLRGWEGSETNAEALGRIDSLCPFLLKAASISQAAEGMVAKVNIF